MERNKFTPREIQILKNNPYTYRVTEYNIFYSKEFKEEFWRRYQEGESPRMILEALGYDPDMLGPSRVTGVQINIKKQAESEGGFTEGKSHRRKGHKKELYSVENKLNDETIIKMQHEILYLRQEVEFLKKITSLKNTTK